MEYAATLRFRLLSMTVTLVALPPSAALLATAGARGGAKGCAEVEGLYSEAVRVWRGGTAALPWRTCTCRTGHIKDKGFECRESAAARTAL